jgi:hypothetical protein
MTLFGAGTAWCELEFPQDVYVSNGTNYILRAALAIRG